MGEKVDKPSGGIIPSFKQCQFPAVRQAVVTQDIIVSGVATDFEVAVIGGQPAIDNLNHVDPPLAEVKMLWNRFTTMAGIADHPDLEYRLFQYGLSLLLRRSVCPEPVTRSDSAAR